MKKLMMDITLIYYLSSNRNKFRTYYDLVSIPNTRNVGAEHAINILPLS